MTNKIIICFILCLNFFLTGTFGQGRKYTASNAHAHNDYNHPVPFYTAYNAGFGSIEADIILKNGQLYVAHDTVGIRPKKTLESLYLDPLQEVIKKNKGFVYADSLKNLFLLVDLKTAAEPTLDVLLKVLQQYKIVTSCPDLRIVITGNQPDISKLLSYPPWLFFDGKLNQTYTADALNKIALFSEDFRNYSSWNGEGIPEASDRKKIENAVTKAHTLNKPIRFWAAPDVANAWYHLMGFNVDYINTDKIQEISSFLVKFPDSHEGQ